MNLEYFIARRIAFSQRGSLSRFIIIISIVAVSLSLSVMIISTAMVNGFQKEISRKVFGFNGHILITAYDPELIPYSEQSIKSDEDLQKKLSEMEGVAHVQQYVTKIGVLKAGNKEEDEIEGLIFKGVGEDFDWKSFRQYIVEGDSFKQKGIDTSKNILVSKVTADRLNLSLGQKVFVYFVDNAKRISRLRVYDFMITGIYNTGINEYDKKFALLDISRLQKLNDWCHFELVNGDSVKVCNDSINGYEIFLNDIDQLDQESDLISDAIPLSLYATTFKKINPNIFDWLSLQSVNEVIILTIMIIIAIINMATSLLILILERTTMIGVLKAIGATGKTVINIFLLNAAYILIFGLLVGNVLGLGICFLQQEFSIIRLPEESYYVSVAPVHLDWLLIGLINIGTLVVCIISLIIPALLVLRIKPVEAIRWE